MIKNLNEMLVYKLFDQETVESFSSLAKEIKEGRSDILLSLMETMNETKVSLILLVTMEKYTIPFYRLKFAFKQIGNKYSEDKVVFRCKDNASFEVYLNELIDYFNDSLVKDCDKPLSEYKMIWL